MYMTTAEVNKENQCLWETMQKFPIGAKVTYNAGRSNAENGIVKEYCKHGRNIWVVYKCNHMWDTYRDYTGEKTAISNLTLGWKE